MRRTAPMIDSRGTMRRITWEAFARIARRAALTLPIEQTVAWDFFDAAMDGREHARRYRSLIHICRGRR